MSEIIQDQWGRSFKTLRLSLTSHCNLACTYCVEEGVKIKTGKNKNLSANELAQIVSVIHEITPLETIRLTGGEPLLFQELSQLIRRIKEETSLKVKITTNGVFLKEKISDLKFSGLDSINVSLDALDEDIFFKVTRRKDLSNVLEGIETSVNWGIPVKINMVVMKGINEEQIVPVLHYASSLGIAVRFLEVMPMGHLQSDFKQLYVSEKEILKKIEEVNPIYPLERAVGSTARYWMGKKTGTFGIISNISKPFCSDCDRLRIDSQGKIFGCLSVNEGFDLSGKLDNKEELVSVLKKALAQKQSAFKGSDLSMKAIGG